MKWQIYWQIYPQYWHLVVKNGNLTFLLLELILADEVADLPPPSTGIWCSRMAISTFLLLQLILEDEVADLLADLPPVMASSGQEWQFNISTVRAHIGR